jgi:hypothetical protein
MRNEVDTFGLLEGVGPIDDNQGSETTDSELAF